MEVISFYEVDEQAQKITWDRYYIPEKKFLLSTYNGSRSIGVAENVELDISDKRFRSIKKFEADENEIDQIIKDARRLSASEDITKFLEERVRSEIEILQQPPENKPYKIPKL